MRAFALYALVVLLVATAADAAAAGSAVGTAVAATAATTADAATTATAATAATAAAATAPTKALSRPIPHADADRRGPGCRAGAEILGMPALVRGGDKHTARDPELTAERAAIAHATRCGLTLTAVLGCFLMVTPRGKHVGVALVEAVLVIMLAILLPPGRARWLVAY